MTRCPGYSEAMVPVLLLFLLPVGGGIPAGVLLAHSRGLAWPLTAGLYFLSDVLLALAFEPILRLLAAWLRRAPFPAHVRLAVTEAMARTRALLAGTGAGPLGLVGIAFGLDPMSGRAAALAAGHGAMAGWAFALTGDMVYYAVIASATLGLNAYVKHPGATIAWILGAMFLVPLLVMLRRLPGRARA